MSELKRILFLKPIISYIFITLIAGCYSLNSYAEENARIKYFQGEACYTDLMRDTAKIKYRENWFECIKKFNDVYKHSDIMGWKAAGLYMCGKLYFELYKYSFLSSDKETGIYIFRKLIKEFPDSRYKQRAYNELKIIDAFEIETPPEKTSEKTEHNLSPLAKIDDLRHWSSSNYSRVVIDLSQKSIYSSNMLKKDPSINKPQRLYIDIQNCRLGSNLPKDIPVNDNLLQKVRAGQFQSNIVRVVIDIKSFERYEVFHLSDPYRIVIDIWGKSGRSELGTAEYVKGDIPKDSLRKQLALGVNTILIDPGHGGKDPGAKGYYREVYEKDITLSLSKILAEKIKSDIGCKVFLTRNKDEFLSLEERTAIANTRNADIFISIHTNASKDKRARGIETYLFNLATDNDAILVAARENAVSEKNISDLESILKSLMHNVKYNESVKLASYVQDAVYEHMESKYTKIKSKGVKKAPFYVLMGAQMPSILIETSFITNPEECKRLTYKSYQEQICDGIIKGLKEYIEDAKKI